VLAIDQELADHFNRSSDDGFRVIDVPFLAIKFRAIVRRHFYDDARLRQHLTVWQLFSAVEVLDGGLYIRLENRM
jgi:hypothetical protein